MGRFKTNVGSAGSGWTRQRRMQRTNRLSSILGYGLVVAGAWLAILSGSKPAEGADVRQEEALRNSAAYRGPLDLLLLDDQRWCVTANELSNTISLIDMAQSRVVAEVRCGERPAALAAIGAREFLVTCRHAGTVERFKVEGGELVRTGSLFLGFEPLGVAVDAARQVAFVGLVAAGEIAELDLPHHQLVRRFPSGKWPRQLAVSPDGKRLAVGLSGEQAIAVHDASSGELMYSEPLSGGINIGQLQCSADSQEVYFPWMVYRSNPITISNIQQGWVLASRVARVRLDGPSYREAISLDVPRRAVADPYGLAMNGDESRMVVTSAGTHELLVYRRHDLPFIGVGGPGDLIDRSLLQDADLFYRIELGGRPLGVRAMADPQQFLVANHTLDQVQIVDLSERRVSATISLGTPPSDAHDQLVHRGLELFHDAGRSLDQWYSCASCHLDGGSNARAMDTWNDGTELTLKSVLPLAGVTQTGPWTWHGWQDDLRESIQNSFTTTMQGDEVSSEEVTAVEIYLASLESPPNPYRGRDGQLSQAALRGKKLFHSSEIGCSQCHSGDRFTDGLVHDVGLSSESDKYEGFNTPSLVDAYRKVRYLHDGRAKTLEKVLTEYHQPEVIGGGAELTEAELADLISYVRSL